MNEKYKAFAEKRAKPSPIVKNCIKAFVVGGTICLIGQGLHDLYRYFGAAEETVKMLVPITIIALTALLTGLGVFDCIAKHAGAGTLVPITGFANSVVSPAIDSKSEGLVLGVGAKIFTVAGPVLLYGALAGAVYGTLYWLFSVIQL